MAFSHKKFFFFRPRSRQLKKEKEKSFCFKHYLSLLPSQIQPLLGKKTRPPVLGCKSPLMVGTLGAGVDGSAVYITAFDSEAII